MNNNHLLNRVFSQKMIRDLIHNGNSSILDTTYSNYCSGLSSVTNEKKIRSLYTVLDKHYRNEYFYKNTMINKMLLGRHSLNTTTALSEVWINRSKADFVMINGKAVVYEIKTDLDNLERLETQINDYYKAFGNVEVIVSESHVDKILNMYGNTDIGISLLTKRNTISKVKDSQSNFNQLDITSIYKLLRKPERIGVLSKLGHKLEKVDSFSEYDYYLELFRKSSINELYKETLKILKKRDTKIVENSSLFKETPYELRSLLYFSPIKNSDYELLKTAIGKE